MTKAVVKPVEIKVFDGHEDGVVVAVTAESVDVFSIHVDEDVALTWADDLTIVVEQRRKRAARLAGRH